MLALLIVQSPQADAEKAVDGSKDMAGGSLSGVESADVGLGSNCANASLVQAQVALLLLLLLYGVW